MVLRSLPQMYLKIVIPFPISAIAMAIPGRFSRRASDRSVTVCSEEMKTKCLLCIYTIARSNMKRSDGFVHYGKEIKRMSEVYCKERKAKRKCWKTFR